MKPTSRLFNKWGNPTLATQHALDCFQVNNLDELKAQVDFNLKEWGGFYVESFYRIRSAGKDWVRDIAEFLGEEAKAHFVAYETKHKGLRFRAFAQKEIDFQI